MTATETMVIDFEELSELHDIVELGPNWNTIDRIVITLNLSSVFPVGEREKRDDDRPM